MKASLLLPIISAVAFALPQDNPAESLFENAQTFMSAEKYKEALTDYENLINNFSATPWAAKALLEVGNYYLKVEDNSDRALTYFSRIQAEYPQSEEAPAAYYFKALIVERQGTAPEDLEGAVADLIRMENLFPGNAWQSGGFFLFGKLSFRLQDYDQSLRYFQRLEFNYPKSSFVPQALLLSARVAFLKNEAEQASLILARLQSKYPGSGEADMAAALLRLQDHVVTGFNHLEPDRTFFGSTPKRFQSPRAIGIGWDGGLAIQDSKNVHFTRMVPGAQVKSSPNRDLVDFAKDPRGRLVWVYETRIANLDGSLSLANLNADGSVLRDIKSAAVDHYGRIFVVDSDTKDLRVFGKDGTAIKTININKPRLVRCWGNEIWVLNSDSSNFSRYDSSLQRLGSGPAGLSSVVDFCLDLLGNAYILHDRGNTISIFRRGGEKIRALNLKSGAFPLKQAQGIAVDAAGGLYLSDRRSGAVFRFH